MVKAEGEGMIYRQFGYEENGIRKLWRMYDIRNEGGGWGSGEWRLTCDGVWTEWVEERSMRRKVRE